MMTQGTWVLYTTFRFGWSPRDNGIAMFCIGLATVVVQGWMMYVLICCNLLAFAAGPALQGIISRGTPPGEQGELMGSLQSINSIGVIVMPLLGSAILGAVSHLPPSDPRIGSTFFVSAGMQALAVLAALRHFRRARQKEAARK